ncbi:hypothetical protein ACIBF5_02915 [Micromonospora sp. NPDC050417]|uniref:hypothetical protein n=1 Tax=Micromonospora sp. NPDC050417 TaxID=3364280 RepID=UPI0037B1B251
MTDSSVFAWSAWAVVTTVSTHASVDGCGNALTGLLVRMAQGADRNRSTPWAEGRAGQAE